MSRNNNNNNKKLKLKYTLQEYTKENLERKTMCDEERQTALFSKMHY